MALADPISCRGGLGLWVPSVDIVENVALVLGWADDDVLMAH